MKKAISLFLAVALSLALAVPALAYDTTKATQRANELYAAGLFNGYGKDADGNPVFGLDDTATRAQGITMFVRVLGKGDEAERNAAAYDLPFTDLPDWCRSYVGYAYQNNYTKGTGRTTFSPDATLTGNQFLTFCLRSLGYVEGKEFSYTSPNELAAKLKIIDSEQQDTSGPIKRGDMVLMAYNTLYVAPSVKETLAADNISKPSGSTKLLPEKVSTLDFDADNNRTLKDSNGNFFANIEHSKGMVITSSELSRSSSGKEAVVEYIDDMESLFGKWMNVGGEWISDSEVMVGGERLSYSDGKYKARVGNINGSNENSTIWLNFIAYVSNKDVAKALYGICVEKATIAKRDQSLDPMPAELVEKYGGTLVSDVQKNQTIRVATISVGGYTVDLEYASCEDFIVAKTWLGKYTAFI